MIAPYAVSDDDFGGRAHREDVTGDYRAFELDRHRILTCTAFRRLQGKTQVYGARRHDHFRTRLIHTLEVAEIARSLARRLQANEDLSEAIALAHDLGHPPFGHAGEVALNEAMRECGGFNHNTHALRVVEYLEHPFPAFRGLNLTGATRSGLASHCTRYDTPAQATAPDGSGGPSVEAQIASLADRFAYNCHDLEDAIGQGIVTSEALSRLDIWRLANEIAGESDAGNIHAVRRRVLDALLIWLMNDTKNTSLDILSRRGNADDVARDPQPVVVLSRGGDHLLGELEAFLRDRVYRQHDVARSDARGRALIGNLFRAYEINPDLLPERFALRVPEQGRTRVIGDYIAGMTDRFCRREHDAHGASK